MKPKKKDMSRQGRFYSVVYAILAVPLRFLMRIHIHGRENEPLPDAGGCLVIGNHMTWSDAITLCISLRHRQVRFMAKKELFKIPLLNAIIRGLGAYPVNRSGADTGAIRNTVELLKNNATVGMFPQGHRYNGVDPRNTKPKMGAAMIAARANVPILPVFIKVKNNKASFFCRKDVYIGKPITLEELNYDQKASGEYERIMSELFERTCSLGDIKEQ